MIRIFDLLTVVKTLNEAKKFIEEEKSPRKKEQAELVVKLGKICDVVEKGVHNLKIGNE